MTMLETRPESLNNNQTEQVAAMPGYTLEQVVRFVTEVQPKLQWQNHLGRMAINHPNIFLGEE